MLFFSNFLLIFNMLCLYNILLYIYNFYLFLDCHEKSKNFEISGHLLGSLGTMNRSWSLQATSFGMICNLIREFPFDAFSPAYFSVIVLIVIAFWFGIYSILHAEKLRKQTKIIDKDELTDKIGYTTWKVTGQIMFSIIVITSFVDSFIPFLQNIQTKNLLMLTWFVFALILWITSIYFSKNPDKIWL